MVTKKLARFVGYILLIFIALIVSGEGYLYYVEETLGSSDYYFYVVSKQSNSGEDFLEVSKKASEKYNVELFTVKRDFRGNRDVEYTVYATGKAEQTITKALMIKKKEVLESLVSGKIIINLKDLSDFDYNNTVGENEADYYFMLNGDEKSVERFRQALVDDFGISTPTDNGKSNDATIIIIFAWITLALLTFFFEKMYIADDNREIAIKLINGKTRGDLLKKYLTEWLFLFVFPFVMLFVVIGMKNEIKRFFAVGMLLIAVITIGVAFIYLLAIKKVDPADAYRKNVFSVGSMRLLFLTTSCLLIMSLVIIPITIKNVNDGLNTYKQKDVWDDYSGYYNAYFMSKGENSIGNFQNDEHYRRLFYSRYREAWDITLLMDLCDNGGPHSSGIDSNIIYANKPANKNQVLI